MQHAWRPKRPPHRLTWVVLGHGLLLWAWVAALHHTEVDVVFNSTAGVLLRLLPARPVTAATIPPEAVHHPSHASHLVAPQPPRAINPPVVPAVASPLPSSVALVPDDPPAPGPATPTATQPLMQTDATRQALRAFARQPLLSERAASATERSPTTGAGALASQVGGSLHGDCSRGDYLGGGMGLLSLPFLVAAQAAGHCAR